MLPHRTIRIPRRRTRAMPPHRAVRMARHSLVACVIASVGPLLALPFAAPDVAALDLGLHRVFDGPVSKSSYGFACTIVGDM